MDPTLPHRYLRRRLGVVRVAATLGMLALVAAGVAIYLFFRADMQLSPQLRNELVDGFFPASARHVGLANDIRNAVRGWRDLPIEQLGMPVLLVGAADDPYQSGPIVRYSSGRIVGARVVLLERGGHILVGHEQRIQQEVRELLTTHLTNK